MTVLAVRSVALTTSTATAWKNGGVAFARRGRTTNEIIQMGYQHILNLGKSSFQPSEEELNTYEHNREMVASKIWNHGADIRPLLWPGATRELFNEYLPPVPTTFPADAWIKAPGAHGRGKYHKALDGPLVLPPAWDYQQHIEGQEWRLITVGHKLVQDLMRHGPNGDREYEWVPMADTPMALKNMARGAAMKLPGRNVIAWDLIQQADGTVYLFEGNTCPGVNDSNVRRIVVEMETHNA